MSAEPLSPPTPREEITQLDVLSPEPAAPPPDALPPVAPQPIDWQARLAGESHLPPQLREQLAAALAQTTGEQGALPLESLLEVLRESLPADLGVNRAAAKSLEHPSGEAFFRGADDWSDEAAERVAREQLARCGLLK